MTAAFFFVSLYLQQALGYSALRAGLAMLPLAVILIIGGLASRQFIPVVGRRSLLVAGGFITAAGLTWLAATPTHSAYLTHILGPALVCGVGLSLMLLPVTLAANSGVGPRDAGAAAGLLNTARQLGGAVGLAVLTTVAATVTTNDARHAGSLNALVHGYHVAFLAAAGVMVAAALTALALPAREPKS
jgi:MFS family permease